jgi:hypothetical protein
MKSVLKEPSTWAGVASVAQGISLLLAKDYSGNTWALLFGGLAAIFLREGGG